MTITKILKNRLLIPFKSCFKATVFFFQKKNHYLLHCLVSNFQNFLNPSQPLYHALQSPTTRVNTLTTLYLISFCMHLWPSIQAELQNNYCTVIISALSCSRNFLIISPFHVALNQRLNLQTLYYLSSSPPLDLDFFGLFSLLLLFNPHFRRVHHPFCIHTPSRWNPHTPPHAPTLLTHSLFLTSFHCP